MPKTDAEIEREREVEEERESRMMRVLDIDADFRHITGNLVRDWVRANLVPDALLRLHGIGMGTIEFETPTAAGNVVLIEAPPIVQVNALKAVVAIGVPTQIGLTSGDNTELPGVIALGEMELHEAREEAHAGRHQRIAVVPAPSPSDDAIVAPASSYEPPSGYEVSIVEEGVGAEGREDRDQPPGELVVNPSLAREILAKRRAQRG